MLMTATYTVCVALKTKDAFSLKPLLAYLEDVALNFLSLVLTVLVFWQIPLWGDWKTQTSTPLKLQNTITATKTMYSLKLQFTTKRKTDGRTTQLQMVSTIGTNEVVVECGRWLSQSLLLPAQNQFSVSCRFLLFLCTSQPLYCSGCSSDHVTTSTLVTSRLVTPSRLWNYVNKPANDSQVTFRVISMLMVPRAILSGSATSRLPSGERTKQNSSPVVHKDQSSLEDIQQVTLVGPQRGSLSFDQTSLPFWPQATGCLCILQFVIRVFYLFFNL